jgi:hypothetical protein
MDNFRKGMRASTERPSHPSDSALARYLKVATPAEAEQKHRKLLVKRMKDMLIEHYQSSIHGKGPDNVWEACLESLGW